MGVTAKELAKRLGLSETAVSMALNNKPGVSVETRNMVIQAAENSGYDFAKLAFKKNKNGSIYCIIYRAHNAVMSYTPIEAELVSGIEAECKKEGYKVKIVNINFQNKGLNKDLQRCLEDIRVSDCVGMIVFGTEMKKEIFTQFIQLPIPVVLMDSYFDSADCHSVIINNEQGAYEAASYLIGRCGNQPGYLSSSYQIENFVQRRKGFEKAVREHGMSVSRCITHRLSPQIEGAFADMLEIIDRKDPLAKCYFAENDFLAIGAMKALKLRGYKVPEDISIIGFDNISEGKIVEPSLTTVNVPRQYMGKVTARQLIQQLKEPVPHTVKIEVSTSIVKRFSC